MKPQLYGSRKPGQCVSAFPAGRLAGVRADPLARIWLDPIGDGGRSGSSYLTVVLPIDAHRRTAPQSLGAFFAIAARRIFRLIWGKRDGSNVISFPARPSRQTLYAADVS